MTLLAGSLRAGECLRGAGIASARTRGADRAVRRCVGGRLSAERRCAGRATAGLRGQAPDSAPGRSGVQSGPALRSSTRAVCACAGGSSQSRSATRAQFRELRRGKRREGNGVGIVPAAVAGRAAEGPPAVLADRTQREVRLATHERSCRRTLGAVRSASNVLTPRYLRPSGPCSSSPAAE